MNHDPHFLKSPFAPEFAPVTSDGGYGVLPSDEFDGDPASVIFDYDPFEIMES
ncbi:hypothetical protein [Xanthobacter autotrophicus]|uniref:hypothetical protein n=1 Tax=Xanthobacter autotrophicus TaxID=280 RepID=UPI003729E285